MKKILFVLPVLVLLAAGCNSSIAPQTQDQSKQTNMVSIQNFAFSPSSITVKKGDTVTWTNKDSMAHTVTGSNGGPNSQNLATNATYSFTFDTVGTFNYHCSIHPSMQGTVTVAP